MPTREDSFDEDPIDSDQDSNDDPELITCPYCGKSLVEDADVCPSCGSFILHEDDSPERTKPVWWVLLVIVLILGMIGFGFLR